MSPTRTLAGKGEAILVEQDGIEIRFGNILVVGILENELGHTAARIDEVERQLVLQAVHGYHSQLVLGFGELDARDVAIGIDGNIELIELLGIDIVGPRCHPGVHFACHRVLIDILSRI